MGKDSISGESGIWDAVIIGSGIGGLTCGAFLARAGLKVLVLEQHTKTGGYAHSFKRKSFTFESAVHCVPLSANGFIFHLLKMLGIEKSIETIELNDMYHVAAPGLNLTMPSRCGEIEETMKKAFPFQAGNIDSLLENMKKFYDNIEKQALDWETAFVPENAEFASQYHNLSYENYLAKFINDPMLRFFLGAQWPYGGSSPQSAPALFYVLMFIIHYLEGSHSIKGGFSALSNALAGYIVSCGGAVKTRCRVTGLEVDGTRVSAVVCASGERFETRLAVSNISPYLLHNELIPPEYRNRRWIRRLSNLNPSVSSVSAYLGMKEGFDKIVDKSINFWFAHTDAEKIYRNVMENRKDDIDHLILLRSVGHGPNPTLTLMNFARKDFSSNWKLDKIALAERLVRKAEEIYPGLSSQIELIETGSPATFERYTLNTDGALYGFENTKNMYGEAKMPISTHISNLFMTGHWAKPGGGLHNVMYNAYNCFHIMKKTGFCQ
jgi:prolycopene isomerase